MTTSSQILLDTAVISAGRVSLFVACRYYLLRSLYHDLRHLSSTTLGTSIPIAPLHENIPHSADTELDELPPPVTSPQTPSISAPRSQHDTSEYHWHSTLSCGTFSLCFSESCILFILVVSQATDVFSQRSRSLNWKLSLGLLLFTIFFAAPLQQCLLLTYRNHPKAKNGPRRSFRSQLVLTGALYVIYLIVLSYIPLPSRLDSPEFTTATLSRLVVLGTVLLGILAGFGAAATVFTYFQLVIANRDPVSDVQIVASERALFRVRNDLLERQRQVERSTTPDPEGQGGFFSGLNPFSGNPELSSLRREIQGLEMLEYQMSRNLKHMQRRRTAARHAGTLRGRLWAWVGQFFALYCAFRVLNSIINLLYPLSTTAAVSTPDLLASLVARVAALFVSISEVDIAAASRQFSLLLVGVIILSSMRRALRGVTRVLKLTSKNLAASLLLLILAQLMGTYLLSTLIQLRTSFPAPSADTDLNLFATLPEYQFFGPLWDGAFLTSVTVSGAVKWFDEKVNGLGPR